jgi:hypothetical protein
MGIKREEQEQQREIIQYALWEREKTSFVSIIGIKIMNESESQENQRTQGTFLGRVGVILP